MHLHLRDLIRAVRCSKTAADERSVIKKESAEIRTSFKETNSQDVRFSNIQKLIYIYLLGYPVQFGQLECLKLVASNKYSDKRVGYLGVMVLLDENQEILTLLTNSLKNDLQSPDDYIVGLGLCTLSALASEEVSQDLVEDVLKLIGSSRSFIRKKAVLAALRIIRRVPETIESFIKKARSLLGDKNHGVQLGAVALLTDMCVSNTEAMEQIQKMVPIIVRQLRGLLTTSSHDHEVGGINDPFLQIGFLRLLRLLGNGSIAVADEINDILTQVMTQTEESKNVGTSVLYECIRVVLAIPSEKSLRVLAINLLGKFLEHRDNNIRYIALSMLLQAMVTEATAVQRVQSTVVQCLHDSDISIRGHAIDLTFALINKNNVRKLTNELISLLPTADSEFKPGMTHKLFISSELFSPSSDWDIEVKFKTLYLAGNDVTSEDMNWFISDVCSESKSNVELQRYITRVAYSALHNMINIENETTVGKNNKFVMASVWMLGEFGDIATESDVELDVDNRIFSVTEHANISVEIPALVDIIDLLSRVVKSSFYASQISLTSLGKLCGRESTSSTLKDKILTIFKSNVSSTNLELQNRSVQFLELFNNNASSISSEITDKMPAPTFKLPTIAPEDLNPAALKMGTISSLMRSTIEDSDLTSNPLTQESKASSAGAGTSIVQDLLGLMDDISPPVQQNNFNSGVASSLSGLDMLSNDMTTGSPSAFKSPNLLDDLKSLSMSSHNPPFQPTIKPTVDYLEQSVPQTQYPTVSSSNIPLNLNEIQKTGTAKTITPEIQEQSISSPAAQQHIPRNPVSANSSIVQTEEINHGGSGYYSDYQVYFKNDVKIVMHPKKSPTSPDIIDFLVTFSNLGNSQISDFSFQVAVPKSQRLQMLPPSGNTLEPNSGVITQSIRIANPSKAIIRLRMKIMFKSDILGNFNDIAEFGSFGSSVV
ncbi:hypothetical protein BB559_004332 [Furculomyces boomerangus]|uniref:AP-1 complex subunit gamma n=1 Tax=Furculomyces boomerangus TaxID=61424 RepID=A0A2T9YFG8_9FUNG|nr:hypothetical protein BB559_004332 [Furculomyces boomerangus]